MEEGMVEEAPLWKKPVDHPAFRLQQKLLHMQEADGVEPGKSQIDLYQRALTTFMEDELTEEELEAAHVIVEKWNGPKGPTLEVKVCFAQEMWRYCGMQFAFFTGWKNENGIIQACSMDLNNEIYDRNPFNGIHTLDGSWQDYVGAAFKEQGEPKDDAEQGEEWPTKKAKKVDPETSSGARVLDHTLHAASDWSMDYTDAGTDPKTDAKQNVETDANTTGKPDVETDVETDAETGNETTTCSPHLLRGMIPVASSSNHCRSKTPMLRHTFTKQESGDDENSGCGDGENDVPEHKCTPAKRSRVKPRVVHTTGKLQDMSEYNDGGIDVVPLVDQGTAPPHTPRVQHTAGKLKPALKHANHSNNHSKNPAKDLEDSTW
ncbi:hypothetical protein BKA83DRAFT_13008, partial [Pisolithus microcarpus]